MCVFALINIHMNVILGKNHGVSMKYDLFVEKFLFVSMVEIWLLNELFCVQQTTSFSLYHCYTIHADIEMVEITTELLLM